MTTMPECDLLGSAAAPPARQLSAQRKRMVPRARVRTEIAREFPHNRRLARIRAKVVAASASRRMAALATSR
jgi:hypothetical protein